LNVICRQTYQRIVEFCWQHLIMFWNAAANNTMQILIDSYSLRKRVGELADQITNDYRDTSVVVLGILNGAAQFMIDLIGAMADERKASMQYDFVDLSSYQGSQSSGRVVFSKDTVLALDDRNVLIVDGIIDTGLTLSHFLKEVVKRSPRSLKVCTLLDKPSRREHPVVVDYCGFSIEDLFVVGYGMDYEQRYRALPYIGIYDPAGDNVNKCELI
jgi:hypoxanthine phosphoribosyltransferase